MRSASLRASSTRPTARKVRPQHSGRPGRRPRVGTCTRLAGRDEHRQRRVDILRLEIAVEGVGEQHDLRAIATARSAPSVSRNGSRRHSRQLPPRAEARAPIPTTAPAAGHAVAQVQQPGQPRCHTAHSAADSRPTGRAMTAHVLAARAACTSIFMRAMSTPVGHSRRHALHETHSFSVSAISSEVSASGPSWPVMRKPQRIGAAARDVALVPGDPIARAHDAARERRGRRRCCCTSRPRPGNRRRRRDRPTSRAAVSISSAR